jgi:hypothetical protein
MAAGEERKSEDEEEKNSESGVKMKISIEAKSSVSGEKKHIVINMASQ